MPVNGNVLALSLESDSEILASTLREEKGNENVQDIAFHAITFDQTVSGAFLELLRHKNRNWRSVEFVNCRGEVENAIRLALSIDRLDNLHIVRNIELFDGYRILGTGLEATKSLKKLRLTSTVRQVDAVPLSAGIAACRSLEIAELRWTVFEEGSIETLASVGFAGNKTLKSIDFFGCNLGDEELQQIFSSLTGHPTLESLLLNGNKCGERGSQEVAVMLRAEGCALQKLDLSFQRLDGGRILGIVPLMEALIGNVSLETLDLTGNGLDDDAARRIARTVIDNKTLRELFLARNKFTDIGVTAIARTLPGMEGLKKLSLWGNNFGELGARELLNGMVRNMELCDLHLFQKFECSDQIQYFTNINRGGECQREGRVSPSHSSSSPSLNLYILILIAGSSYS